MSPRPKFLNHLVSITFHNRIFIIWVSRLFDLGDLGVLRKSPVNIFNDYIFEISGFHWSKCTIECAICLTLISKSTQARCEKQSLFTTSKTDRQVCQRISLMKTNTLYACRELAFLFTFCLEGNKSNSVCFITKILWWTFWRNNWRSLFDAVKILR